LQVTPGGILDDIGLGVISFDVGCAIAKAAVAMLLKPKRRWIARSIWVIIFIVAIVRSILIKTIVTHSSALTL
jgi:hypothetical protein